MVRLELKPVLEYEVFDSNGADFVFNIHAAQTARQSVGDEHLTFSQPVRPEIRTHAATATRFMRLHAAPGPLRVSYEATVDIDHHVADPDAIAEVPVRLLPLDVVPHIYPSRYCESDRLLKLANDEFGQLVARLQPRARHPALGPEAGHLRVQHVGFKHVGGGHLNRACRRVS